MTIKSIAILLVLPLTVLTGLSIIVDGPTGFSDAITLNYTSLQIWVDLVIAMVFWCAWVLKDAKSHGRSGWAWVIGGLLFGAFSPLLYMIIYERWPASDVANAHDGEAKPAGLRMAALASLLLLGMLTAIALSTDGLDIPATVGASWSNIQIWFDLVIMILIWIMWMIQDARSHGHNPWGWGLLAAIIGSFSPLLYLIAHGRWPASSRK